MPEPLKGTRDDNRSAMARASDARPFRPYVYRGGDREPAQVTPARERHRALAAAVTETAGPGPDEDSYEWRREQLLENGGEWPPPAPEPCQRCGGLQAELDGLKAENEQLRIQLTAATAAQEPAAPPPVRCKQCGYLTSTTGHKVMCDA